MLSVLEWQALAVKVMQGTLGKQLVCRVWDQGTRQTRGLPSVKHRHSESSHHEDVFGKNVTGHVWLSLPFYLK